MMKTRSSVIRRTATRFDPTTLELEALGDLGQRVCELLHVKNLEIRSRTRSQNRNRNQIQSSPISIVVAVLVVVKSFIAFYIYMNNFY